MQIISYDLMKETLQDLFLACSLSGERAGICAGTITDSTFDGIFSHGINMVPGFVGRIRRGLIDIEAIPEKKDVSGVIEQWDGRGGIGIVNARIATDRAMEIAGRQGMGCVAMSRTNHWFRAGSYGWQAVNAGFALVCWTNTAPNMPAWGAARRSVGNNPLVIAVPHSETPVVLDIAMSQFALGKIKIHARSGELLPVPGGYAEDGTLTQDAAAIGSGDRVLPMGYWKGSGLALVLDLLAVLLSGGLSTAQLADLGEERDVSQVFIALRVPQSGDAAFADRAVRDILDDFHRAPPLKKGDRIFHPGQGVLERRERYRREGVPVAPALWKEILDLKSG